MTAPSGKGIGLVRHSRVPVTGAGTGWFKGWWGMCMLTLMVQNVAPAIKTMSQAGRMEKGAGNQNHVPKCAYINMCYGVNLCPLKVHTLKFVPPGPQNVTLFGSLQI